MQDVASDNGIGPMQTKATSPADGIGGLVAAVESKMSELMAWHAQQVKQLETDKTVLLTQADKQEQAIQAERDEIACLRGELDTEKAKFAQEHAGLTQWRDELNKEREGLKRWQAELESKSSELDAGFAKLNQSQVDIREKIESLLQLTLDELGQPMKLVA